MRSIPPELDPGIVAAIDRQLRDIEADNSVKILLAVESGSRAWGFPSPDSDYDCRFIYRRSREDYLKLFPFRDVIEAPLGPVFDVNGWDLAKALKLLLKGNAVVIEWLTSPITYGGDAAFRDKMLELSRHVVRRDQLFRHYFHLGIQQRNAHFADGKSIKLKKAFYALRPAAALRWMTRHPDQLVPPMHFPTLMAQSDIPAEVAGITHRLLEEKAKTREMGTGPLPAALVAFIDAEFAAAQENWPRERPLSDEAIAAADACFREALATAGEN